MTRAANAIHLEMLVVTSTDYSNVIHTVPCKSVKLLPVKRLRFYPVLLDVV